MFCERRGTSQSVERLLVIFWLSTLLNSIGNLGVLSISLLTFKHSAKCSVMICVCVCVFYVNFFLRG